MVGIERRGKNLIYLCDGKAREDIWRNEPSCRPYSTNISFGNYTSQSLVSVNLEARNGVIYYLGGTHNYPAVGIIVPCEGGKTYTISGLARLRSLYVGFVDSSGVRIKSASGTDSWYGLGIYAEQSAEWKEFTFTFTAPEQATRMIFVWYLGYKPDILNSAVLKDLVVVEGSMPAEYEPPSISTLEADIELVGFAGVYDELLSDGMVLKRWNREQITIASGAGTVSKSGTGSGILIASDGVPYDCTVSGTSVSTSAPDGEYTIIYQLTVPELKKVSYTGELVLMPGKNYIIADSKTPIAISIKGARKYLEG